MIVLIWLIFVGIFFLDVPEIVRNKNWKEGIVFGVLFCFALVLCTMQGLGVQLPRLAVGIEKVFKDILHLSYPS